MFGLTSVDNSKQNKEWGRVVNQQAVTCAWRSLNKQRRRSCIGCLLHTHTVSWSTCIHHHYTLSTIGYRAFPVAGARVWNGLPLHVTSASSLTVLQSRLKTHLFRRSFP